MVRAIELAVYLGIINHGENYGFFVSIAEMKHLKQGSV